MKIQGRSEDGKHFVMTILLKYDLVEEACYMDWTATHRAGDGDKSQQLGRDLTAIIINAGKEWTQFQLDELF